MSMILFKKVLFSLIFLSMIFLLIFVDDDHNLVMYVHGDEAIYHKIVEDIHNVGYFEALKLNFENKTPLFYVIQNLLKIDETLVYARTLNVLLIIVITILIYKITSRKESLLFFVIPWFLNSLWLTNEIFEITLVLLSIIYVNHSGLLIGLSFMLRPYGLIYVFTLKRKQIILMSIVVLLSIIVIAYYDFLSFYVYRLLVYSENNQSTFDIISFSYWILFLIIGYKTPMFKYGLLASIPIIFQYFNHYYMPAYTFWFVGYLLSIDKKVIK